MILITKRGKPFTSISTKDDYLSFLKSMYVDFLSVENVIDVLPPIIDTSINHTDFVKSIKRRIRSAYPKSSSQTSKEYWVVRGYSDDDAEIKIKRLQRSRSVLCVEYWESKGYSTEESRKKITELQSKRSTESSKRRKPEYWGELGYTDEQAEFEAKKNTCRTKEYWIFRGHSEDEAADLVRGLQDTRSLSSLKKRYGNIMGESRYKENSEKNSKRFKGKNNPMYGRPAPYGSGFGISGYYKKYYFRSTLEYFAIKYFETQNIRFEELDRVGSKNIRVYLPEGRTYRPDFLINSTTIVEVKPADLIGLAINQIKMKCCVSQYPQYDYVFMTQKDIPTNYNTLRLDVDSGVAHIDKGKLDKYNRLKFLTEQK